MNNGGSTDTYRWTQTLGDVSVFVAVPKGTRGKQVVVDISQENLKVGLVGEPPIIDGALHARIKTEDSFWLLEGGEIQLTLQKANGMEWWKRVVVGDAEIDVSHAPGPRTRTCVVSEAHAPSPPLCRRKRWSRKTHRSPIWMERRSRPSRK